MASMKLFPHSAEVTMAEVADCVAAENDNTVCFEVVERIPDLFRTRLGMVQRWQRREEADSARVLVADWACTR